MPYKALITDLDGTAVPISSDGSDVDEQTRTAVQSAIKAGYTIACATGREWELAKPVVRSLGLAAPCIIDGGTRIVDPQTGESIWEKHLDAGAASKVLDIFKANSESGLIMHSADPHRIPLTKTTTVPQDLRYLYLLAIPEATAVVISDQINATTYAAAHFTPSWEGGGLIDLHVTHPEATKEYAVGVLLERAGVSKAEAIGMGDSGNDMPIFQATGLKVAVGNASASLKAMADYIAPHVENHALQHVIDKFLLNTT